MKKKLLDAAITELIKTDKDQAMKLLMNEVHETRKDVNRLTGLVVGCFLVPIGALTGIVKAKFDDHRKDKEKDKQ